MRIAAVRSLIRVRLLFLLFVFMVFFFTVKTRISYSSTASDSVAADGHHREEIAGEVCGVERRQGGLKMQTGDTNPASPAELSEMEKKFIAAGLVNIADVDDSLMVDLKYASPQNFLGADVYGGMKACYLQRDAALKLKNANDLLKCHNPKLRILLADGCRPRSVQRRMWAIVEGTPMQRYVANPSAGSLHNYGVAVDVTICDENGNRLDMGTPMDYFGALSHPREEVRFLKEGKLTKQQVAARRLLRNVMQRAGFQGLEIEWWHFNACDKKTASRTYQVID